MQAFDLLIVDGTCVFPQKIELCDIGIVAGKITALGNLKNHSAKQIFSAKNLHVLPGVIDSQVHFRDPGLTHKEDWSTGSRAALLGGVTSVFDMPNTIPNTLDLTTLQQKISLAKQKSFVNFGCYIGASEGNWQSLAALSNTPGCCGIKIFMGSSTGNLLLNNDDILFKIFNSTKKNIALHAEDEDLLRERKKLIPEHATAQYHPEWRNEEVALRATQKAVTLAEKAKRKVHILHVSSQAEVEFLSRKKNFSTVEVTPQHLTLFAPKCYDDLGNLSQMNPPIRDQKHFEALWKAVQNGTVDVIGSDHAPHTLEEKKLPYPQSPSGMPGVQTLLPLMLHHHHAGRISLQRLVELTSSRASQIFSMLNKGEISPQMDADLTIVDLKKKQTISKDWLASKCDWSPFENFNVTGWPRATIVNGMLAMENDEILVEPSGHAIEFTKV